jgi:hypothetical protein
MTLCPECGKKMKFEKRQIMRGIYTRVEVCPKCQDELIDDDDDEDPRGLFIRKAFKVGGSLGVRIPKEIADVLKINDGQTLSISVSGNQIVIEKADWKFSTRFD